jgi:hypothetical protein
LGAKVHSACLRPCIAESPLIDALQLEGGIVRCPIELLQSEFKRSEYVRDLFVS